MHACIDDLLFVKNELDNSGFRELFKSLLWLEFMKYPEMKERISDGFCKMPEVQ